MKKITLILIALASAGLTFGQAAKKVIVEDETGAWCGYCPGGRTTMEDILNTYPNAIGLSNHAYDSYDNSYTEDLDTNMNSYGYPGGMVDRKLYSGQTDVVMDISYWKAKAQSQLASTTPVAVYISSTYNASTRQVTATVTANFVAAASGDLRISCLLVEDSVVNSSDPQHNYFGNNGACGYSDPSSPWSSYPCQIPAYTQRDVVRANFASSTWGDGGIIPASVSANSTYTKTYTYTIPTTFISAYSGSTPANVSHMHLVAFVSQNNTTKYAAKPILNANIVRLGQSVTAVEENHSVPSVEVKQNVPNPFSAMTAIQFTLNVADNVSIKVYNTMGQVVNNIANTKLVPGEHTFYWAGDDANGNKVSSGVYFYAITTSDGTVTKQMIFAGE